MDFQSEKSFAKLRLRAFQPYLMLKHVEDVKDYFDLQHLQHALTYIGFETDKKEDCKKLPTPPP